MMPLMVAPSSSRGSARAYGVVTVSALKGLGSRHRTSLLSFNSLYTGYAIQRNILAGLGRNGSSKESMLWDKKQLLNSTYEEG